MWAECPEQTIHLFVLHNGGCNVTSCLTAHHFLNLPSSTIFSQSISPNQPSSLKLLLYRCLLTETRKVAVDDMRENVFESLRVTGQKWMVFASTPMTAIMGFSCFQDEHMLSLDSFNSILLPALPIWAIGLMIPAGSITTAQLFAHGFIS